MSSFKKQESLTGKLDWLVIIMYLLLVFIGWFAIFSAVYAEDGKSILDSSINSGKQFQWMVASFIIAFIILIVDSRFYITFSYPIYGLIFLFVASVFVLGTEVKGQQNWIRIGSFQMQPSELAKLGVALALSKYLSGLNIDIRKWKDKWKAFAIIGVPMLLVAAEGDVGQAVVFLAFTLVLFRDGLESYFLIIGASVLVISLLSLLITNYILVIILLLIALGVIYFVRRNRRIILIIAGLWLAASVYVFSVDYVFNNVLKPHHRDRVNVLLGKKVEAGRDWNVRQSIIAIGSGGVIGKGYLQGTQTKLKFVPEQSTDFIFSSIGEEFGFMGALIIVSLYIAFFFRLLFLAERQRSKFSRIYGYSVACILFFHFMVNIGMAIGVAPVIGIPLPFISYGGSSLLTFTVLLFIFIRMDTQRYETMR